MSQNLFLDLTLALQAEPELAGQERILKAALADIGFENYLYALIPTGPEGASGEFITCTNFRADWMDFYAAHNLQANDYALEHIMKNTAPIIWSELFGAIDEARIDPRFKPTADATRDFLGQNGISIAIPCFGAHSAVLSVTTDPSMDNTQTTAQIRRAGRDLQTIAHAFHAGVNRQTLAHQHYGISAREIEVLKWLADGLTAKQVAHKTKRSPHTVNKQILSARKRLGCATTIQAVAKALILGLI
jgi:LuxR family transcriptional regulator